MRYHFISGLPRSGSTLLAAILKQNPRFHAGMSSPVSSLMDALVGQFSARSEWGAMIDQDQRHRLCRGLFENYYFGQVDSCCEVVFDTGRAWSAHLAALMGLFPGSKMICCVRNVAWIMDSMERLYQADPFENTALFRDPAERGTVYSRVDTLAQRDRLVGFPWAALKQAYYGEHAGSLLLIDYELLARVPEKVVSLIYEFIEEPLFEHDYSNVEFDAPAFDTKLGVRDLHKVRKQVEYVPRRTILPPDLFQKYSTLSFWEDENPSAAHVIRPLTEAPSASAAPPLSEA